METFIIKGERIAAGSPRAAELAYQQIKKAKKKQASQKLQNDARLARTQPRGAK